MLYFGDPHGERARLLRRLGAEGPVELAGPWRDILVFVRAEAARMEGEVATAVEWTKHYRRVGDTVVSMRARVHTGVMLAHTGDSRSALPHFVSALADPAHHQPRSRAEALNAAAMCALDSGEFRLAEEFFRRGAEVSAAHNLGYDQTLFTVNLGRLALLTGRPDEALVRVGTAASDPDTTQDPATIAELALVAALAHERLGTDMRSAVRFGQFALGYFGDGRRGREPFLDAQVVRLEKALGDTLDQHDGYGDDHEAVRLALVGRG